MKLFNAHLVVLDTETTGIPARHAFAEAIEFAAVLVSPEGEEVDTFSALIRPEYTGPEIDAALAINHITREELMTQAPAGLVTPSILGWLKGHGYPYVTAFNIGFDKVIVEKMGLRHLRWALCVMEKAKAIMGPAGALPQFRNGQYKWPSLAEAGTFFEVPPCEPAHRALADARRAALIAVAIRRRELGLAAATAQPDPTPAADPADRSAS